MNDDPKLIPRANWQTKQRGTNQDEYEKPELPGYGRSWTARHALRHRSVACLSTREMTVETPDGEEIDATVHYEYEAPSRAPDGWMKGALWIYKIERDGVEIYVSDEVKGKLEDILYERECGR
jgi:hypothetical protein